VAGGAVGVAVQRWSMADLDASFNTPLVQDFLLNLPLRGGLASTKPLRRVTSRDRQETKIL
jgi:hypothetical protein